MPKRCYSVFTWDFGKHSIELTHPDTILPTMRVNQGFSGFKSFYTFLPKAGVISSCQNIVYVSYYALCNEVVDGASWNCILGELRRKTLSLKAL